MSFEIYFAAITTIDRGIVEKAFEALIAERREDGWWLWATLDPPHQGRYTVWLAIDDEPEVKGFCVHRPPGNPEFWDAMFTVLSQAPSVLYWPGGPISCCVANADFIPDLFPDMIESLGTPPVVASGAEIVACIRAEPAGRTPDVPPVMGPSSQPD